MSTAPSRVVVDAQAFQNPWSARRGIGRYLGELLAALEESDHRVRMTYVLNPDLPVPRRIQLLAGRGRVTFSDRLSPTGGDVFHVPSPFEPAPIDRVWPAAVRGLPLVVTVHDLIPFVLKDRYLKTPSERRWFRTRLELVRRANRVIAVSKSTANDVIEHADIAPQRVVVTGEGPPEHFEPARDRAVALRRLRRELPDVRADFVIYQGGMDPRKNIDRLIRAYAGLPPERRRRHQLVVVCELSGEQRQEIGRLLGDSGVKEDVLFPGYVTDETLVLLFQCAKLSIFPSLYEGFGLPVAEAIACRTPVIGSRTSSIPELIEDDEALFDPYDPASIRATLRRALEDPAFLERLTRARLDERHTWRQVATQTAQVYAAAGFERRVLPRRRPRLAVAVPFSGHEAQATRETYGLLDAFARRCDVDVFLGSANHAYLPPGVERQRLTHFELIERARGGYDALISVLNNNRDAAGVLAFARAKGGHVILRNPALAPLYAWLARERPDLEPRGFAGAIRSTYEKRLPALGEREISPGDAVGHGMLMTSEVVAAAQRVIVHSAYARQLVELDAAAADANKVAVLPPAFPAAEDRRGKPDDLIVARVTENEGAARTLVEALQLVDGQRQDSQVALVIANKGRRLRSHVRGLVEESEIRTRATFASEGDAAVWRAWLRRAAVAVQLLDAPELVVPGFLAESLALGVPTVVSDVGPLGELPDDAVVKLAVGASPPLVADAILTLIDDETPAIGVAAAAHARANGVEDLADRLVELIFG